MNNMVDIISFLGFAFLVLIGFLVMLALTYIILYALILLMERENK